MIDIIPDDIKKRITPGRYTIKELLIISDEIHENDKPQHTNPRKRITDLIEKEKEYTRLHIYYLKNHDMLKRRSRENWRNHHPNAKRRLND